MDESIRTRFRGEQAEILKKICEELNCTLKEFLDETIHEYLTKHKLNIKNTDMYRRAMLNKARAKIKKQHHNYHFVNNTIRTIMHTALTDSLIHGQPNDQKLVQMIKDHLVTFEFLDDKTKKVLTVEHQELKDLLKNKYRQKRIYAELKEVIGKGSQGLYLDYGKTK